MLRILFSFLLRKFLKFQFRYSKVRDRILIFLGSIFSIICGAIQPYIMTLFGEVTGVIVDYARQLNASLTINETQILEDNLFSGVQKFSIYMTVSGVIMITATYVAGICFSYSALSQIFYIRKLFLERTLNQDISWYDVHKTGDFASTFTE